jgi:hypothetical protein
MSTKTPPLATSAELLAAVHIHHVHEAFPVATDMWLFSISVATPSVHLRRDQRRKTSAVDFLSLFFLLFFPTNDYHVFLAIAPF